MISDFGDRNMFTVFEVTVIAAVLVFFLYITEAVVSHCKSVYLKRKECSVQIKVEKENNFIELFQNEFLLKKETNSVVREGSLNLKVDTNFC